MGSLSGELFDRDSEHEAYWEAVSEALQVANRSPIPDIARQMSLNHLQHMASLMSSEFEAWVRDLAESFSDAYVLAEEEEWDDLDGEDVSELIDKCMITINRHRLAVGSDAIMLNEFSVWVSLVLLGLQSDVDEWAPLNDYVRTTGAWERLEWVLPTYLLIGEHLTSPRPDQLEQWKVLNRMAWYDGVFLSLLYGLGYLSSQAGTVTFASDSDRPLSGTLFDLDPHQYQLTAAQLMQATAHAVPDVAKELHAYLINPFIDSKTGEAYGQYLRDTFECGYMMCVSETWDGLDESKARKLIDVGLRRVIAEKDTRDPELLIRDPEYRIRNVAYGITASMPYMEQISAYLDGLGAYQRINALGDLMINGMLNSGAFKRRHASKLQSPLIMSFMLGVSIGLLDQLGEVPSMIPERLV